MQNNLYEFGGSADVYLKALCDFGEYHKGDVVAFLPNVNINFTTKAQTSLSGQGTKTLLTYYSRDISKFELSAFQMNDKIMKLLNLQIDDEIQKTCHAEYDITADKQIYLDYIPSDSKTIQVVPSIAYEYYSSSNSLQLFPNETQQSISEVEVYYSTTEKGTSYLFNHETGLPYLSAEIQLRGNINKKTGNALLYFGTVSLSDKIEFDFANNTISNLKLSFDIIHEKDSINKITLWG